MFLGADRWQQWLLFVVAGSLLLQVNRTQRQADDSLVELEQQRKETTKIQQASNDELDKVQLRGGTTGEQCALSQITSLVRLWCLCFQCGLK